MCATHRLATLVGLMTFAVSSIAPAESPDGNGGDHPDLSDQAVRALVSGAARTGSFSNASKCDAETPRTTDRRGPVGTVPAFRARRTEQRSDRSLPHRQLRDAGRPPRRRQRAVDALLARFDCKDRTRAPRDYTCTELWTHPDDDWQRRWRRTPL